MLLHMIWPLVDPLEIARNDLIDFHAVLKHFRLPSFIFYFDFRHDWVVSLYSEHFIGNLVEFLHLALSQQCAEFLKVLGLLKGTSDSKLY